jgi:hypothetical protein
MPFAENDPDAMAQLSGFMQGLAQLGWTDGRNVRMDLRWAVGSVDRTRSVDGRQVAGAAHGDRAGHQGGHNYVQSRHGSQWRAICPARIRGSGPIVQGGADRSVPFIAMPKSKRS